MVSFVGYHGTDERGASLINLEGFQDSPSDSWLGPGVYFFESQGVFDGLKAAEWWASTYKKYSNWVILKAGIVTASVLDMFGSEADRIAFRNITRRFLKKHLDSGGKEQDFNLKPVFMFLSRKFEVIRCLVDASRIDAFQNYIVGYPQIQLCVTKSQCINAVEKVKSGAN
jgi:hypothetical protein